MSVRIILRDVFKKLTPVEKMMSWHITGVDMREDEQVVVEGISFASRAGFLGWMVCSSNWYFF